MSLFATDGPATPQLCKRYADEITLLDEPGPETPDRIAARAHLAECGRCQRERQALLAASTALRRRVQTLMAQAPTFTEAEIAAQAALQTRERAAKRPDRERRDVVNDGRRLEAPPAIGKPRPSSRATSASPLWRRALSAGGGAVAIALITTLLVMTLTGHLLGRPSSARHKVVTPSAAALPLSALKIYAPGRQFSSNLPGLVAFRASDGARVSATPTVPVTLWGSVIAQGVCYQLVMPNENVGDPNATIPAILSATRISDDHTLWSERIDAIFTPDLVLVNGVLYLGARVMGVFGVDPRIRAVYAYRASDGARLWRSSLTASVDGPPVVSDGVVYVVAGETAIAMRADDGEILWQTTLPTGGQNIISAWTTAAGGALYIYASLTSPTGQKDGFVVDTFALRSTDGGALWRADLGTDVFPADGPFAPVVADGVVYIRVSPTKFTSPLNILRLVALRAADGAVLWRYTSTQTVDGNKGLPNIYPPAIMNGVVYVTEDGGALTALNARDGHTIWRVNVDANQQYDTYPYSITSPLAIDGAIFVIAGGQLVSVRASDGGTRWRVACGEPQAPMNYQAFHMIVAP